MSTDKAEEQQAPAAEPKRENPVEQFEKARVKAEDANMHAPLRTEPIGTTEDLSKPAPAGMTHELNGAGGVAMQEGGRLELPEVDRRLDLRYDSMHDLDLGYGGIGTGPVHGGEGTFEFAKSAPAPTQPSPLHGTYAGELVRRIRAALEEFEQLVANDARDAAGRAHDLIADAVNELRGHFHRE